MSRFPAPLRPQVETLAGSRIREVSDAAFDRAGLIPLWFGESDRATPRFIGEAAKKALDEVTIKTHMGKWLFDGPKPILKRRDKIIEHFDGMIAKYGEAAVFIK